MALVIKDILLITKIMETNTKVIQGRMITMTFIEMKTIIISKVIIMIGEVNLILTQEAVDIEKIIIV